MCTGRHRPHCRRWELWEEPIVGFGYQKHGWGSRAKPDAGHLKLEFLGFESLAALERQRCDHLVRAILVYGSCLHFGAQYDVLLAVSGLWLLPGGMFPAKDGFLRHSLFGLQDRLL